MSQNDRRSTRFALRAGNRVAYDVGEAAPPGDVVLFIHDLLSDRNAFADIRAALPRNLCTRCIDLRGHGASATVVNQWYTVGELAADLEAVLDNEGVARAHLVGHGLGGVSALELALCAPERVASLVLIEPAAWAVLADDPDPLSRRLREERRASDREAADAAYKGLVDRAIQLYAKPRWPEDWATAAPRPRLGAIRRNASALTALLPALDAWSVQREALRQLTIPATVVVGTDASPLERHVVERLTSLLPASRLTEVALGLRPANPLAPASAELASEIIAHAMNP